MDNGTPSRPSAFSRFNQKEEVFVAVPMSASTPSKGVPLALPGTGIQNPLPPQMFYPPELLRQLIFQPYMNGQALPPEYFSISAAVAAAASPVSVPSVAPTTSTASSVTVPSMPINTQTPRSFSKGAQHHLRQLREDHNDSGNESSSLSPVSEFSLSRSPSTSSRSNSLSNSFTMTSILKPGPVVANVNIPSLAVVPTVSAQCSSPKEKPLVPRPVVSQPSTSQRQPIQPTMAPFPMYPQSCRGQMPPQFMGMSPLTPHGMGMVHPHFMPQMGMSMQMQFDPLMSGPMRETCQICNDHATGYHYGVISCEGCKGFFRRNVQKRIGKCHREGGCKVDRVNRNRCQACRFKKCLEMGMTRESVRQDRGRKRKNDDDTKAQLEDLEKTLEQIRKLVEAFKSYFPEDVKMQTIQDVCMRTRLFADALQQFSTIGKGQMEEIAQKSVRGVALLRSAKTSDDCDPVLGDQSDLTARIRAGIEIATYEDVAVLTAVYMASLTDDIDLQDQLSKCLRAQLKTRMPNEEHLYLALMAKLRLLN